MRLREIALRNFGSYADATITLDGIAAAVITGANGAGKSTAFVDAPLWALFGKCRTDTDRMIRLGDQEMMVTLTFDLNGERYQVIRKRSTRTKAGKSDLALMVWGATVWGERKVDSPVGEMWHPVAVGMAEASAKIEALLNLDYDLLTATGFLLQGKADRFSKASPSERKAILAQILRLDQYADFRQRASRHWTAKTTLADEKARLVEHLAAKAADLPTLEAALLAGEDEVATFKQLVADLERDHADAVAERATQQAKLDALSDLGPELQQLQQRMAEVQAKEKDLTARRDRVTSLLETKAAITEKVAEEVAARATLADLRTQELSLNQQLDEIAIQLKDINAQVANGATKKDELAKVELQIHDAVRAYQQETERLRKEHEALQRDLDKVADNYLRDTERMADAIKADEQSILRLGQVPCDATLQGQCQFTINAVAAQARLETSKPALAARLTDRQSIIETLAPDKAARLTCMRDTLALRPTDPEKIAGAEESGLLVQRNTLALAVADWRREDWDQKLRDAQAGEAMKREGRAMLRLSISAQEMSIQELAAYPKMLVELEASEAQLPQLEQDLAAAQGEGAQVAGKISLLQRRLGEHAEIQARVQALTATIMQMVSAKATRQAEVDEAVQRQADRQAQITTASAARDQWEIEQGTLATLTTEAWRYEQLAEAYRVIPVLIMETAIPLLEEEANRVLARISPSGMRVRLDTQKALKSRDGLAETLEIIVRDVYGERPYESYSGGEKFRLDLALRIGLTKMLANRAGARLETLVIDEGLGSLDDDGLAQLRDCLAKLGEEFPLVLVVTHVEAMKHTFPAQIVVSKTDAGSSIEVIA